MKNIKITVKQYHCKFCKKEIKGGREYLANPFCNDKECLDVRREANGSVDMRDNIRIIDHKNGFVTKEPIDRTRLWKASEENKKIIKERQQKYYDNNRE